MGLDMYAFSIERDETRPQVDFKLGNNASQFHYWRKHPNLHGWMQQLYEAKGGTNPDFNCDPLILNIEDIDALEAAIKGEALPKTHGFFFGETTGEEKEDDLEFIKKAREIIAEGRDVVYDSWW